MVTALGRWAFVIFPTPAVRTRAARPVLVSVPTEGKNMKKLLLGLSALSLVAGAGPALAAPCKDAKGKFIKCPAVPVAVRCKDKKGKFIKCPAKPKMCRNAQGHFATCK